MKIETVNLLIAIVGSSLAGTQIQPVGNVSQVELSVIRRTAVNYYLLTKQQPITFTITQVPDTGLWLRIYTRMFFSKVSSDSGWYFLSFITQDSVRCCRFETKPSTSTIGPRNQTVGQWRSFYVNLPKGVNSFKIALDSGSAETIGVRLKVQPPRRWEEIALSGLPDLHLLVKQESLTVVKTGYFLIKTNKTYSFATRGPAWLRLRFRIDFTPEINGGQSYVFRLTSGERVIQERTFRVLRDLEAEYKEVKNVVPSVEKQVKVKIGEGEHRFAVSIAGTIAKTASMAIERLPSEKYE